MNPDFSWTWKEVEARATPKDLGDGTSYVTDPRVTSGKPFDPAQLNPDKLVVGIGASAGYPFSSIAPNIDMRANFTISKCVDLVDIDFFGVHDLFPYYEIVVQREDGSRQVVYKYDAKAEGGFDGPNPYNLNATRAFKGKLKIRAQNVK